MALSKFGSSLAFDPRVVDLTSGLQNVARPDLCGRITAAISMCDGISEYLTGGFQRTFGNVTSAPRFNGLHHGDDFRRFDLRRGPWSKTRQYVRLHAALHVGHMSRGNTVLPVLQPAVGNGLKRILDGGLLGVLLGFSLLHGINAGRQQSSTLRVTRPSHGKGDIRILAQCHQSFFLLVTVRPPPELAASRHHQEIKPATICQSVRFIGRQSLLDGGIGKRHISPSQAIYTLFDFSYTQMYTQKSPA